MISKDLRAWYKLKDLFYLKVIPNKDAYFYMEDDPEIIYSLNAVFCDTDFNIDFYTYMDDIHGNKIYNSDIIRFVLNDIRYEGVVNYSCGAYYIVTGFEVDNNAHILGWEPCLHELHAIEIIGNIYLGRKEN